MTATLLDRLVVRADEFRMDVIALTADLRPYDVREAQREPHAAQLLGLALASGGVLPAAVPYVRQALAAITASVHEDRTENALHAAIERTARAFDTSRYAGQTKTPGLLTA